MCVQLECWESWLQHISSYQYPINCCLRSFNTSMNLSLDFIASEMERERENDISIQLNILEINFNRECYVILVNAFFNILINKIELSCFNSSDSTKVLKNVPPSQKST